MHQTTATSKGERTESERLSLVSPWLHTHPDSSPRLFPEGRMGNSVSAAGGFKGTRACRGDNDDGDRKEGVEGEREKETRAITHLGGKGERDTHTVNHA